MVSSMGYYLFLLTMGENWEGAASILPRGTPNLL